MAFGLLDDVEFQLSQKPIVYIDELEIHLDAFLNGKAGEVIGDAVTICLVGQLLSELGEVVLAIGVLDVGEQFGTFLHEMVSSPEEIPR